MSHVLYQVLMLPRQRDMGGQSLNKVLYADIMLNRRALRIDVFFYATINPLAGLGSSKRWISRLNYHHDCRITCKPLDCALGTSDDRLFELLYYHIRKPAKNQPKTSQIIRGLSQDHPVVEYLTVFSP